MRHPECCAEDWRPSQKLRSVQGLVGLLRGSVHALPRKRPAKVLPGAYATRWRLQAFVGMRDGEQCTRPAVLWHRPGKLPGLPSDCFMCGSMRAGMLDASAGILLLRTHVQTGSCLICKSLFGTCDKWAFHCAMWPRRFWICLFPCPCLSCAAARIFAAGWRAVWAAWDSGGPV